MTRAAISPTPLGPLGVRIPDLQPALADDAEVEELRALLARHLLMFFGPHEMDDPAHQTFMERLGAPYIHPLGLTAGVTSARVTRIIDDESHPPFQDSWHTDVTWDPEPPNIGSLRCIEMPSNGGDTMWADMHAALDHLPVSVREDLAGRRARHEMKAQRAFSSKAGEEVTARTVERFPGVERPVINTHPVTGRPYLDVNEGFTTCIVGMDADESDVLLATLFEAVHEPGLSYRHQWTEGEFCIWDERATQHRALPDHFPQRREMARFVVR